MAINAASVFELRTTGTTNGGGGFVTGASGSDYSQQDAVQIARTDLAIDALIDTSITSAATPFTTAEVGNIIRIFGGTGFTTGWYEIIAVDVSNVATLDRSIGTLGSTGGSGNVGGAISTLQDAFFETLVGGNIVYIKAGTYNMTENINVAKDGDFGNPIRLIGYNATRGDNPTGNSRPLVNGVGQGFTLFFFDNYWTFDNIRDETDAGSVNWSADNLAIFTNCSVISTSGACFSANGITVGNKLINCYGESSSDFAEFLGGHWDVIGCTFKATGASQTLGTVNSLINSLIIGFGGTAVDLIGLGSESAYAKILGNTFYGAETPAGTALSISNLPCTILNNIFYGWSTAITSSATNNQQTSDYNDLYNNTTDRTNVNTGSNDVAVNPAFTNAASGDFSIGTALKALGFPGTFPGGLSTGYLDIGAVQRQEPGATNTGINLGASLRVQI